MCKRPHKVDLQGDMSYQHTWLPMLQAASGCTPGGLPGRAPDWLKAAEPQIPVLLRRNQELGFNFVSGQRPQPNKNGHIPTTMEWARKLTAEDIQILKGEARSASVCPIRMKGSPPPMSRIRNAPRRFSK